ncbi:MAG: diguanylate cyclase [Alphaproteobacteria bacterium]|nr:diguanylate cyclase [Alphaproteobacteria bacterium]
MPDDNSDNLDGETALAALLDLPDLVCLCENDSIQWINTAGLSLLAAVDHADVVGKRFTDFLGADYAALGVELYSLLVDEQAPIQTKMQGLNGVSHNCELSVLTYAEANADGGASRYVIHARNISEFSRIAENLHLRENYLRDLINNSLSLICECRNGIVRFINQAGVKLLGAQSDGEVIGTPIQDLFHRSYHDIFTTEFQEILNEDTYVPLRLKRMDGSYVDVEVAFTPMKAASGNSFLAEAHDITEHNRAVGDLRYAIESLEARVEERTESLQNEITTRRKAEKRLRHLATHDVLTGLPNRGLLRDRIDNAIAGAERHKNIIALMFIDLDGFKSVNDTLGHDAGDDLLVWVAGLLKECTRATDTVARNGGDEFVVVITDAGGRENVEFVAAKIIERLTDTVQIVGAPVSIGASIGIALCPEDSRTADDLMRQADAAMYRVKKSGKNSFKFFSDLSMG